MRATELYQRIHTRNVKGLRENAIGHTYALLNHWTKTVGMWGVCTTDEILEVLPETTNYGAYRAFKHGWHLSTSEQFEYGMTQPEMCFSVQRAIRKGIGQDKYEMDWRVIGADRGILPVEVVLYDHAFQLMCMMSDLSPRKLLKVPRDERDEIWRMIDVDISSAHIQFQKSYGRAHRGPKQKKLAA